MATKTFTRKRVEPEDILSGFGNMERCDTYRILPGSLDWIDEITYLDWARTAIDRASDEGYAAAIGHAKRAVCRRIDALLYFRHMHAWMREKYPKKMEILSSLGVKIPQIVYSFIIEPRNIEEHDYQKSNIDRSKNAFEMAELFVSATNEDIQQGATVFVGDNLHEMIAVGLPIEAFDESIFCGLPDDPFVFVDSLEKPFSVKIVHPKDLEILHSNLNKFSLEQVVKLNSLLGPDGKSRGFRPLIMRSVGLIDIEVIKKTAGL